MSEAFRTAVIIKDVPGGEAVWEATFAADNSLEVVETSTRAEADEWIVQKTRAWFDERTVMPSPDGDGVVVAPPASTTFSMSVPALAVRVRDASPLVKAPHVAAQVTERVHYAQSLLEEAFELLAGAQVSDLQGLATRALIPVRALRGHLATDVYSVGPVEPVAHGSAPSLRIVSDAAEAGGVA